jgi:MFS family permease
LLILGALVAVAAALLAATSSTALYVAMFAIGATAMPLYALCIATASDATDTPLIQIASGILIMNSLGSIAGPVLVAPLLEWVGGPGYFVYVAACLAAGAAVTLYRLSVAERHIVHPTPFVILPKTTPVAAQLTGEPVADPVATTDPTAAAESTSAAERAA